MLQQDQRVGQPHSFIHTDSPFPHFQRLATQPHHLGTRERIEEMSTALHGGQIF